MRPTRPVLILLLLACVALAVFLALETSTRLPPSAAPLDKEATLEAFAGADPERVRTALQRVRAAKPPPLAWLVGLMQHGNRGIREWSIHAIGDMAPEDPDIVKRLMQAFEDNDDYVRWKAARALGNIGALAAPALPLLEPSAKAHDEVEVVRATAIRAVRQIRAATARK